VHEDIDVAGRERKPSGVAPRTETLERGHRTCIALLTLLMAASWYGFRACISPITCHTVTQ